MLELLIYSVLISIGSVVFCMILLDEDMILGFYGRLISRLPKKLAMPLGDCAYCFSGQIALWYYFLIADYRIDIHLFFITVTIFFTHLTLFIYERTSNQEA